MADAADLIRAYYAAFDRRDVDAMLALLTDDVVHDVNEGPREVGKPAFRAFMDRMNHSYQENIQELVVMVDASGTRVAAEFLAVGHYSNTDAGLRKASGQHYSLPAGAFFEVRDGLIARVTTYYNLHAWLRQIGT